VDKRALVTGGAGFIGSHLVDALLERGAEVRVLDNFSNGSRLNLAHCAGSIEVVEGDIRDLATCRQVCEGMQLVFHQAALGSVPRSLEDPATSIAVNVQGTAHILTAAYEAGARRVVFASSSSVYGDSSNLRKKEGEEGNVLSPYAASKKIDEELARVYARVFDLDVIGLRYFNVYGPRQDPEGPYAAVIPRFFKACLGGEPPTIYGDGEQSRDFTFVEDAVGANLLAAALDPARESAGSRVYNVAAGRAVTVNQLAGAIQEICGTSLEPLYLPPRKGDVLRSNADLEMIQSELGFAAGTELHQGLEASLTYYQELFHAVGLT
jgi:nucleoside-diphosphate-sugar epimerase